MFENRESYRRAWESAYKNDPEIPINIDIELASVCNASCGFCLYGDSKWSKSMIEKDWDGRAKRRFMRTDIALDLIDEAARIGIPAIKFNYRGESTLHPQFTEIVKYARDALDLNIETGEVRKAFHDILINTNGNVPERALEGLNFATKVMISLDSMNPATYKKMRVGLNLDATKATIKYLCEAKHPNIWVRRVISKDNDGEDFVGAVKSWWGDLVHVSEHHAFDRNKNATLATHCESVATWERQYCGYPSQRLIVTAAGTFLPCCIMWKDEYQMGHYPQTRIMDAWKSITRRSLVARLRSGNISCAPQICKNCTSYMAYKRPERKFVQDVEAS